MQPPMRVVIVDPHRAMRSALRALLATEQDVEVAGEGPDLSALIDAGAVDVVLIDGRVAGVSSSEPRSAMQLLSRRAAVVVMGMGEPALYAGAEIAAGAAGYWAKFDDSDALVDLVRAVATARRPPVRLRSAAARG